jgi:hypothetical protein
VRATLCEKRLPMVLKPGQTSEALSGSSFIRDHSSTKKTQVLRADFRKVASKLTCYIVIIKEKDNSVSGRCSRRALVAQKNDTKSAGRAF